MSLIFDNPDQQTYETIKENLKLIVNQAIDNGCFMNFVEKLCYLNHYGENAQRQTGQKIDIKAYPNKDGSIDLTWVSEPRPGIRGNYMYGGLNYHEHSNSWSVNT